MNRAPRVGSREYPQGVCYESAPEGRYFIEEGVLDLPQSGAVSREMSREPTWQHSSAIAFAKSPRNKIPKDSPRARGDDAFGFAMGDGTPKTKGIVTTADQITETSLRRILREELSVALAARALVAPAAATNFVDTPRSAPRVYSNIIGTRCSKGLANSSVNSASQVRYPAVVDHVQSTLPPAENGPNKRAYTSTGSMNAGALRPSGSDKERYTTDPLWKDAYDHSTASLTRRQLELEGIPFYDILAKQFPQVRDMLAMWYALKEPKRTGKFAEAVDGAWFTAVCTTVILLNSMFIIVDTNNEMYYSSTTGTAPVLEHMAIIERLFLAFYTFEIILKVFVHGLYFFAAEDSCWNIFDMVLIMLGFLALFLSGHAVDTTFLRVMRLVKIVKILRAVRLMRMLEPLRVILSCLVHSVLSLIWSLVMMCLIFFIFSTVFVQVAAGHFQSAWGEIDDDIRQAIIEQFGSVQVAMMSLYQACTGGNDWAAFYATLSVTGEINAVLFLFFVAFTQVALLNIITGLFIENALKNAAPNAETKSIAKQWEYLEDVELLTMLFDGIEKDGDDQVGLEDFDRALSSNAKIKHTLQVMGLDTMDAHNLFAMMLEVSDGRKDKMDVDSFVHSCLRLRGIGSSRDIQKLLFRVKAIDMHLADVSQKVSNVEGLIMLDGRETDTGNYIV